MKTSRFLALLALSAAPLLAAAEVAPGDSLAEVRAELGVPRGQATLNDRQILYYDRGEVELQADRVIRVGLRSLEEQVAIDAREERQRGEREERMSQLYAEGTALRDRKLADEYFRSAPLSYQVSFWETFVRSYPGVSVIEPLTIARMRLAEQQAEQWHRADQAAHIADLEARLAEKESATYYGFGSYGHYGSYNPPNVFNNVRYHFGTDTGAPYETPHGAPYETPHGSPYSTPSRLVNDYVDYTSSVQSSPYAPDNYRSDYRPSDRDWRGGGRGRGGY